MAKHTYGWRPEIPDHRDIKYKSIFNRERSGAPLPAKVDLRPLFTFDVYDQGMTSSCTAQAIAAAVEYDRIRSGLKPFIPSRLFIYWNERSIIGETAQDNGAYIRDGVKSLNRWGYVEESRWPFNPDKLLTCPTSSVYGHAYAHKAVNYFALENTDLDELKSCLAAQYPFVFGSTIYQQFEDCAESGGVVKMPGPSDKPIGGHAMLCVGYDDSTKQFIIRNSWGSSAGDRGYFYMPYDYLTNRDLSDDFWTIRKLQDSWFARLTNT